MMNLDLETLRDATPTRALLNACADEIEELRGAASVRWATIRMALSVLRDVQMGGEHVGRCREILESIKYTDR